MATRALERRDSVVSIAAIRGTTLVSNLGRRVGAPTSYYDGGGREGMIWREGEPSGVEARLGFEGVWDLPGPWHCSTARATLTSPGFRTTMIEEGRYWQVGGPATSVDRRRLQALA
jgi:hypothetical protein